MLYFFLLLFSVSPVYADAQPPTALERENYSAWLESIGSPVSPFLENLFDWYEAQQKQGLPVQVEQDPEKLFVSIDRPLEETKGMEEMGDIETGVTYGLETYGVIDAPVDTVLETILFRWGKPIGEREGETYPNDTVYSYRQEKLTEAWGWGNYRTYSTRSGGGVAKDQADAYTLLVRGSKEEGYVLTGSFERPLGKTTTTSSMSIMIIKPTADGKTDYRISGRHLGQSYTFFGIEYGRRNFGFNRERIRLGQKEFIDTIMELKRTGKIQERRPKGAAFYPGFFTPVF